MRSDSGNEQATDKVGSGPTGTRAAQYAHPHSRRATLRSCDHRLSPSSPGGQRCARQRSENALLPLVVPRAVADVNAGCGITSVRRGPLASARMDIVVDQERKSVPAPQRIREPSGLGYLRSSEGRLLTYLLTSRSVADEDAAVAVSTSVAPSCPAQAQARLTSAADSERETSDTPAIHDGLIACIATPTGGERAVRSACGPARQCLADRPGRGSRRHGRALFGPRARTLSTSRCATAGRPEDVASAISSGGRSEDAREKKEEAAGRAGASRLSIAAHAQAMSADVTSPRTFVPPAGCGASLCRVGRRTHGAAREVPSDVQTQRVVITVLGESCSFGCGVGRRDLHWMRRFVSR